jgi:hypothetical protein
VMGMPGGLKALSSSVLELQVWGVLGTGDVAERDGRIYLRTR